MIFSENGWIKTLGDIDAMDINEKCIYFSIPEGLIEKCRKGRSEGKAMALLESYKIGMLKYFLHKLHPEKKLDWILEQLQDEYHIFCSKRNIVSRNTLFNANKEFFWPGGTALPKQK